MENRRQTHASATLYPNVAAYLLALTGIRTRTQTHTPGMLTGVRVFPLRSTFGFSVSMLTQRSVCRKFNDNFKLKMSLLFDCTATIHIKMYGVHYQHQQRYHIAYLTPADKLAVRRVLIR